jgi:hypothetical protein
MSLSAIVRKRMLRTAGKHDDLEAKEFLQESP